MAKAAGCAIWSPNFNNLQQADVEAAHAIGMKVVPWTVNLASDMQRLLDWGVDGLITDYPDRLREVMAQRNCRCRHHCPRRNRRRADAPAPGGRNGAATPRPAAAA